MTEKELSERRAVLCEKYDKILGLTYHFGVADSDRDDVVQEVFVAAYLQPFTFASAAGHREHGFLVV